MILFVFFLIHCFGFNCGVSGVNIDDSFVNDDYCDCPEMTDEPLTAGCSMQTNNQLFKCKNGGIKALEKSIPYSCVDDRVCDCEDGSDEKGNICPSIIKETLMTKLKDLEELRKENETVARRRDELTNTGKENAQKGLEQSYVASNDVEKLRGTEKQLEKMRRDQLNSIQKGLNQTTDKELNEKIEKAKEYFVAEVIPFGIKERIKIWLIQFDYFKLIGSLNPEGINDKRYCLIRNKLAETRNLIAENDKVLSKRFAFNSAIISGDYCIFSLEGICLEYKQYKLCIGENITKNDELIGNYKGHLGTSNIYIGYSHGHEVRSKLIILCGKENKLTIVNEISNKQNNVFIESPCGCSDTILFREIDKQIAELKNDLNKSTNE